jgi:DNA-binding CsgD family transcriptional regulator
MAYYRVPATGDRSGSDDRETAWDVVAYDVTARQLECLAWAGEGKTALEISIILGISARTVEGHLARICAVFGVRKRVQAVVRARELHMLRSLGP